jgi:hypothetical protein
MLILKSDTNRLLLATEFQRVGSGEYWLAEAGKAACRHPLVTAALGGGVGLLAIRSLRRPTAAVGWLGRLATLSSAAVSLWKLIEAKKRDV